MLFARYMRNLSEARLAHILLAESPAWRGRVQREFVTLSRSPSGRWAFFKSVRSNLLSVSEMSALFDRLVERKRLDEELEIALGVFFREGDAEVRGRMGEAVLSARHAEVLLAALPRETLFTAFASAGDLNAQRQRLRALLEQQKVGDPLMLAAWRVFLKRNLAVSGDAEDVELLEQGYRHPDAALAEMASRMAFGERPDQDRSESVATS